MPADRSQAPATPVGGREPGERTRALADALGMPQLGLGVWQVPDGPETERAVSWALEAGYRHLDTAQGYGNEPSVGRALASSGVAREEVFLTTKYLPGSGEPEEEAKRSLERLGVECVDLYLVHWPRGGPTEAWPGMERALSSGLARAIGISNFDVEELGRVIDAGDVPPAVNQVQFSPFRFRRRLLEACEERGVVLEAYSPLGTGAHLGDPTVLGLAERRDRTPAQILLRWAVQRGIPVIPKSTHRERIVENARIFDFELDDGELAELDRLDETGGTGEAREDKWWTTSARISGLLNRLGRRFRP